MPVHIYLGRDLHNLLQEFKYPHEVEGFRTICTYLWDKLHQQEKDYAVVANLWKTSAGRELTPDVVIISELGIGIMELKHYFGEVNCSDLNGTWYAGPSPMKPNRGVQGSSSEDGGIYANPHVQIRDYALQIRSDLLSKEVKNWIAGNLPPDQPLKIHTAVCFTNPAAILTRCKETLRANSYREEDPNNWEKFSIITPAETPEWALDLRFQVNLGPAEWYQPLRLPAGEVQQLATQFFDGSPWREMKDMMHVGRPPFGFLALIEDGRVQQTFRLDQDEMLIGRNPDICSVIIPGKYLETSRKHARLIHTVEGVFLEDADSKEGTYIDGNRVYHRRLLRSPDQVITLGGPDPGPNVCHLQFLKQISQVAPSGWSPTQ